MKKFKFLSKLLAVLVIVPAILLCTACGGGGLNSEAKVDTRGNWDKAATVTTAEFEEFKASLAEDKAVLQKGFHVTQKSSIFGMKMYANAYVLLGEDATKNQAAIKYEMKMPAEEEGQDPTKMSYTMYAKENHVYIEKLDFAQYMGSERKDLVYDIDIDMSKDYSALGEEYASLSQELPAMFESVSVGNDYLAVIELFEEYAGENELIIKKIENGSVVKYQLTIDATAVDTLYGEAAIEKAEAYLIFKNGAFNSASVNMVGKVALGEKVETIEVSLAITSFEGNIDFPNFKNYMGFAEVVGDMTTKMLEDLI